MATPLTRKRRDGTLYLRPPDVEREIDEVSALSRAQLLARFRQPSVSNRLRLETLVHLCRRAFAAGDDELLNLAAKRLLASVDRCIYRLIPSGAPNPAYVHDEVAGMFSVGLAKGLAPGSDRLDMYEISVVAVLKRRVDDVFRRAKNPLDESGTFGHESAGDEADADEGDPLNRVQPKFPTADGPLDLIASEQLASAVSKLPDPLRRAVYLVHFLGLKIESIDPLERTAATVCGVSGRTIRNRLERAYQQLRTLELA